MSLTTVAGVAPISLMCEVFKISRAAYYAAGKPRARREADIVPLPSKPRYTRAEVVLDGIRRIIKDNPAWGVRKVWATLRQDGMRVSRKRVWALMNAHGLVLARDSEPGEPRRGHVAVPEPNRRLATDLTTTWTRKDGVVAIVPTIDCGCRTALALEVTKDQSSPAVLESLRKALTVAFGKPDAVPPGLELRTDHGPQYTGDACEKLATEWHLDHTFAPVGRPTGNAVVERFIRTMKEEVVWLRDWESADELRAALDAWVVRYNEQRPHQSLTWKTPAAYRADKGAVLLKAAA